MLEVGNNYNTILLGLFFVKMTFVLLWLYIRNSADSKDQLLIACKSDVDWLIVFTAIKAWKAWTMI